MKIKLLVHAYIIIHNTVCIPGHARGGGQSLLVFRLYSYADYLIYTSRLWNSYYMAMSVTSCLLCLSASLFCLSVSKPPFSSIDLSLFVSFRTEIQYLVGVGGLSEIRILSA